MKDRVPENIEKYRVNNGELASKPSDGFNGCFLIPYCDHHLAVIVSDQLGWDHVSVSHKYRIPLWVEMCFIKRLFFKPEETVIQYHPPESKYINDHDRVLHLWRKQGQAIELPPDFMV